MAADAGWIVEDFETEAGGYPVRTFLRSLKGRDLAEAIALIKLAGERGDRLRAPQSKALGGGLFELRGDRSGSSTCLPPAVGSCCCPAL